MIQYNRNPLKGFKYKIYCSTEEFNTHQLLLLNSSKNFRAQLPVKQFYTEYIILLI